ncbi:hypothetical protein LSH36_628g02024 [Paralvinella palmiformis]|uniref:ATP synthase subunit b n=1 Tax=Paralvinella palmiformis TaxID=53620 RepID=A0AAD9MUQ1_9ANNE|nr:hypothetical protein LSH36_628g02024 [Paralvinella palmiformis]
MFSKAALRSGGLKPVFSVQLQNRVIQCISTRGASVSEHVKNWNNANKIYYGPQRDNKNYPIKKLPETNPPVRHGFIPESFFTTLYEKTGVTGPYVFGIGLTTYLLSSELWVAEHGMIEFMAFWLSFYLVNKKFGPVLANCSSRKGGMSLFKKPRPVPSKQSRSVEELIEMESGQKLLFEAKRENVDLQLEFHYRQRLADVHHAVKRRLDYEVDVEAAKRRFEQQHMVNWIVKSVTKSITAQQEKESINKCIQDLKTLAAHV